MYLRWCLGIIQIDDKKPTKVLKIKLRMINWYPIYRLEYIQLYRSLNVDVTERTCIFLWNTMYTYIYIYTS